MPNQAQSNVEEQHSEINRYWDQLGVLTASLPEVSKLIKMCFQVKHVPCLVGEAGTGKTQVYKQVAEDLGYDILYYYLAHLEREDIGGIPMPNEAKSAYTFLCEEAIAELVRTNKPTVVVLDEWNRGEKPVMNAGFTLMEQRRWGSYTLPDNIYIGAAMNPSEGSYLVNEAEKDPAFRRRLCFVGVRVDPAIWLQYAIGRGQFDSTVTEFITAQPQYLLDTKSREAGKVYANPASWEKVSDTFKMFRAQNIDVDSVTSILRLKLAGHIGAGVTEAFISWYKENATAINPFDILQRYASKAQKKIISLVEGKRLNVLTELAEAVSLTMVSHKLAATDVAPHLSAFANDLPEEISMALFTKLTKHMAEISDPDYRLEVSRALSKDENFRKALLKIHESHERVEQEIKKPSPAP